MIKRNFTKEVISMLRLEGKKKFGVQKSENNDWSIPDRGNSIYKGPEPHSRNREFM